MKDRVAVSAIGVASALVLLGVGAILLGPQGRFQGEVDVLLLPSLNALLNATSAVLLGLGYVFIRRRRIRAHKICMVSALMVSSLFLISYLLYHAQVGSVPFRGVGAIRMIYYPLLISHIVLAAVIVPLALTTIYRAVGGQFDRHRRIARVTLPVWLYVSVTGVVVYWMLYWLAPSP